MHTDGCPWCWMADSLFIFMRNYALPLLLCVRETHSLLRTTTFLLAPPAAAAAGDDQRVNAGGDAAAGVRLVVHLAVRLGTGELDHGAEQPGGAGGGPGGAGCGGRQHRVGRHPDGRGDGRPGGVPDGGAAADQDLRRAAAGPLGPGLPGGWRVGRCDGPMHGKVGWYRIHGCVSYRRGYGTFLVIRAALRTARCSGRSRRTCRWT